MIQLYHGPMSTCSQRVRLALAEIGSQWQSHVLDNSAGETRTEQYLRINPRALLPAIVVDDGPIIESAVICEYLAECYPSAGLIPASPYERAKMRLWTKRPDEGLHAATGVISTAIALRHLVAHMSDEEYRHHIAKLPDEPRKRRLMDIKRNGLHTVDFRDSLWQFVTLIGELNARLSDAKYLVGNTFTLADLTFISYFLRLEHLQLRFLWDDFPKIERWLEVLKSRQSFKTAVEDWYDAKYLTLMREHGLQAAPLVRQLLDA